MKSAEKIQRNDEFEVYLGRRSQRVRVCQIRITDDVLMHVENVVGRATPGNVRFPILTQIEVFKERTPKRRTPFEVYSEACQNALSCGQLLSVREISDRLRSDGISVLKTTLAPVLNLMAKRGILIKKQYGRLALFRLPLSAGKGGSIGQPVVEFMGSRNEKLGWIVGWQFMHATGVDHPVVRFENGAEYACSEAWIDPAPQEYRHRIELMQSRHNGKAISPPVAIPDVFIWELAQVWQGNTKRREIRENRDACLLHIAKMIGCADPKCERLLPNARIGVIDYLNTWYPGWPQWAAPLAC